MNPMNTTRTTNARKANVSARARAIEIAPMTTMIVIVRTVGRAGRFVRFRERISDAAGMFVGGAAVVEVSAAGIGGTDRDGIVDDVGVMNVDGTDGRVVLVLFPDCEIVMVVGGIPPAVVVFVLL
jgi:hypothetical protein